LRSCVTSLSSGSKSKSIGDMEVSLCFLLLHVGCNEKTQGRRGVKRHCARTISTIAPRKLDLPPPTLFEQYEEEPERSLRARFAVNEWLKARLFASEVAFTPSRPRFSRLNTEQYNYDIHPHQLTHVPLRLLELKNNTQLLYNSSAPSLASFWTV